jgi:hypothetical protein
MKNVSCKININKLIFSVILFLLSSALMAQKKTKIVPLKKEDEIIMKGAKEHVYYKLKQEKPVIITIEGPGQLTAHVRTILNEKTTQSNSFVLTCITNKQKRIDKVIPPHKKSGSISYGSMGVSEAGKINFHVPPGKHTYRFTKKLDEQEACINFLYKKEPDPVLEHVAPLQPLESERLTYIEDKKTHTYFRISEQICYNLSAQPGDLLRVVVRPEYTQKDLAATHFRLSLKVNDTLVHTYSFRSKRCEKAVYETNSKLIPGTLTELYITIPKKKLPNSKTPYYSICLLDKNKTALIKVSKVVASETKKMITPVVKKDSTPK